VDKALNIASTNYPEKLDRRIISRPRRFDRILRIDAPDARVREAYLAKTAADLVPLFADLPDKQRFTSEPVRRRDPRREAAALRALVFVVAVLAAILWVALVRVPPLVFLPIVWLVLARRGFGRRSCRAW